MDPMDLFLELFGELPRAGPGSDASTRRALGMFAALPPRPRVLDVGCGPGCQTRVLLRELPGTVIALDLLPSMLARCARETQQAGLSERLRLLRADMQRLPFVDESFDLIWIEAAIYVLGFEAGLSALKRLVRPGGAVGVSEAVWLTEERPPEAEAFWAEYPEIDSIENKLATIERLGFDVLGHFVLPRTAWTEDYYEPLRERVAACARRWPKEKEPQAVLDQARGELDVFDRFGAHYGYAFFALRV